MNRKALAFLAFAGWGLFALSLIRPAPAFDSTREQGSPAASAHAAATPNCPADIAPPGGDGVVNVNDLLAVINAWGPCPGCQGPGDCPPPSSPCMVVACVAGVCMEMPHPAGTPCPGGVCDGNGNCVGCFTPGDCPPPSSPCVVVVCEAGVCMEIPLPAGSACPTGICDGNGNCVECVTGSECPSPPGPCFQYACIDGLCILVPLPAGSPCPGGVCDGNGNCVQTR